MMKNKLNFVRTLSLGLALLLLLAILACMTLGGFV